MDNPFASLSPELQKYLLGTGLQVGGSLLNGMQQGKTADADRAVRQAQLQQQESQFNQSQDLAYQKAGQAASQMDPLYQQKQRQQQALLAAIVPNAQNVSPTGADGVRHGGIMNLVPQGGFSPDTQAFFSPQARAAAEGDFAKANAPFSDPASLTSVGYGAAGAAPMAGAQDARTAFQNDQTQQRNAAHQALMQTLQQSSGSQDDSPGFWHKLASIAAPIAGIALAPFTGGGSLGLMALGGATGALGAWGAGGNPAMGAATGAAGGAASAYSQSRANPQTQTPDARPTAGGPPLGQLGNPMQGMSPWYKNPTAGGNQNYFGG